MHDKQSAQPVRKGRINTFNLEGESWRKDRPNNIYELVCADVCVTSELGGEFIARPSSANRPAKNRVKRETYWIT